MKKHCALSGKSFEVSPADRKLLDELAPTFDGRRFPIPDPSLSPDSRWQRRMSHRNERVLYRRKCDLTGKSILSVFPSTVPCPVYDQEAWWGDSWDAIQFGRDFDFSRTFTEQFADLLHSVPQLSLYTQNCENSYYTNYAKYQKNCYLVFGASENEDCLYSTFIHNCQNVIDSTSVYSCELCYEGIASSRCYNCQFFMNCRDCSDCLMVEDCQSSKNCILCFGLHSQEYCILNKYVGKAEYEKYRENLYPLTSAKLDKLRTQLAELKQGIPKRASHIYASEDCTGDMILNSKNCHFTFDSEDCEDCRYLHFSPRGRMAMDCTYNAIYGVQFAYETCSTIGTRDCIGNYMCWFSAESYYSLLCYSCTGILGCVGMRQKENCILNKQYSRDDYQKLAARIVEHMTNTGEWGEFFSPRLSFHGYQDTVANEYFPLSEQQAISSGFHWRQETRENSNIPDNTTSAPETITEVSDDILNKTLLCENTGKPYKLVPLELKFYQENQLPIPRVCHDERHHARRKRRTPRKIWPDRCEKTQKPIWSNYPPNANEVVLSEEAYLARINSRGVQ